MQGIEIPIGAPLGQLDKDLKNATNKISNFADTTLGKFAILNKTKFTFGQNFISEADKLASKGKGLGDNLSGPLVKGSNSAAFALTNLGRVAQDAPFGFIGIQNNLNPLLESFSRLKAETGGTGSALKALGQTLIGPAGLGIALSVVSAGILFYQQYQQRANKETEKAKKTNEDYASSLSAVNQIQLVGAQNAAKETAELKALFGAYQNANLPLSQRKDAYAELQKQYPAYFGNLKFEEQASEKVKSAYDKLSQSIIATGRARAGIDLITKNEQKKLENEQKLVDLQTEGNNLSTKKETLLKTSAELQRTSTREGAGVNQLVQANSVQGDINANLKLQNQLKNDNKKIDQDNLRITESINSEILKGAKLTGDIGGKSVKGKAQKDVKTVADVLATLDLDLKKVANSVDITFGDANKEKVKAFATAIDSLTEIKADKGIIKNIQTQLLNTKNVELSAKTLGVSALTAFGEGWASAGPVIAQNINKPLRQGLTDWQLYVNDTLLPQIENNFKTFFDNILMNGKISFDSLGKALLNTLLSIIASDAARQVTNLFKTSKGTDYSDSKGKGGIFSAIGGLLKIGGGKAAAGAAATTAGAGGAGALATGTAATGGALLPILAGVAAVAGIASLFKKKPKAQAPLPQASSTISTSAAGSYQDFGGGRVVFEISGTNLVGVLNRAGAKLQRFG
jgi:hypothetical protein